MEQVRADAANLPELLECKRLGLGAAVSRHQGQGEDGRIILRRPARIADFNDAVHSAHTVGLDAADQSVVVLLHEILFGDVIGAAFGTEDQETVEPGPVIDLPGVAAGRIRDLVRARDRLRLRRDTAVEVLCVIDSHSGLLSLSAPPTLGTDCLLKAADKLVNLGLVFSRDNPFPSARRKADLLTFTAYSSTNAELIKPKCLSSRRES